MTKNRISSLCLIALALLVTGCRKGDSSPVIVRMTDGEIRRTEFDAFFRLRMGELGSTEVPDTLRSEMLDEFIRRTVTVAEAERAGLTCSESELEQAVKENPAMKAAAVDAGARQQLAADLLLNKFYRQVVLRDVTIVTDDVQKYVNDNQHRLTEREGFFVREIRVASKADAERLRAEVTDGKRDFAEAARESSLAANAEKGGLSRYDTGQLPGVLEGPIKRLQPGEVSPVIESGYGFHLFKLERRVRPLPPEERRAQLDDRRAALAEEYIARRNQETIDAAVERFVTAAGVTIIDSALGFTYSGKLRHN